MLGLNFQIRIGCRTQAEQYISFAEFCTWPSTLKLTATGMPCSQLPPEIWIQIYRWAAHSASSDRYYATEYEPFHSAVGYDSDVLDKNLRVKWALVRVCRQWKAMAMDLLYEDVRVKHGEQTLADALDSAGERAYGKWVRRVELPYASTVATTSQHPISIAILERCPELQILVRPPPQRTTGLSFQSPALVPPLTSLKRLEWWSTPDTTGGGINSLQDVLSCTPNLQYLSLGGKLPTGQPQPGCHLPALTTLSVRLLNDLFIEQICRWNLPALANVIVDNPQGSTLHWKIWETFGSQLRVVELGTNLQFYRRDHITPILFNCPDLVEMNYYINFTMAPQPSLTHSSLRCVRLHGNVCIHGNDWKFLDEHLAFFSGSSLPALKRIVLYGEWDPILTSDRFIQAHHALDIRGCNLEFPDGTLVTL
jgi:hypothetical protein